MTIRVLIGVAGVKIAFFLMMKCFDLLTTDKEGKRWVWRARYIKLNPGDAENLNKIQLALISISEVHEFYSYALRKDEALVLVDDLLASIEILDKQEKS